MNIKQKWTQRSRNYKKDIVYKQIGIFITLVSEQFLDHFSIIFVWMLKIQTVKLNNKNYIKMHREIHKKCQVVDKNHQQYKMERKYLSQCKCTVKPVLSGHSKRRPKLIFKTDYRFMQVKSIEECSKGSILQYFLPSLSYHLSLISLFCLFLSDHLRQVLLYVF